MATIKDIARHTGLGLATVSKYINGGNVREENRLAIESAIDELGYTVNEMARGLRAGRSRTIWVVIPELHSIFLTTILTYVEDILRSNGYSMVTSNSRSDEERERQAIQFLVSKRVDGIINVAVTQDGSHLLPAINKNIPVVLIDKFIYSLRDNVHTVMVDNVKASEEATRVLIDAGHKNIGIILGSSHAFTAQQRLLGYRQALEKHNIAPLERYVRYLRHLSTQDGYEAAVDLLKNEKPTALFATNYEITLGAIMAINDLQLTIPGDVALIGFDNLQLSKIVKPKLTIVEQPLEEIASSAAEIMLAALENKDMKPVVKTLSTKILIGESV